MKQPPVTIVSQVITEIISDVCEFCIMQSATTQFPTKWVVTSSLARDLSQIDRLGDPEPAFACGVHLVRAIHTFADQGDEVIVAKYVRGNHASA